MNIHVKLKFFTKRLSWVMWKRNILYKLLLLKILTLSYNSSQRIFISMFHMDPWPNRQSEILCTRRICKKKRKQSRCWAEICEFYQMIYADTLVRYAEEVLSKVLKKTPRSMVKRSYGLIWQSVFVSVRPSVSITHQRNYDSKKNIFYNQGWRFIPSSWL